MGAMLPFRFLMACELAGRTFTQEHDVGDHRSPFFLESIRGQPNRADEVGLGTEILADRGIHSVQGKMRCDHCQDAARLQRVNGLGEEIIVQRQLLTVIVELQVRERHVADSGVDAPFGQLRVAEILDTDVVVGMQQLGDAAGNAVELNTDKAHFLGGMSYEVARAATRFEHLGIGRDAQMSEGVMDGLDHRKGRVKRVECGPLRRRVFFRGEQLFEFRAELFP